MVTFGRTDLASEAHSHYLKDPEAAGRLRGVQAENSLLHDLPLCSVRILDAEGAKLLGKAEGQYYTLTLPSSYPRSAPSFGDAAQAVSELLSCCLPPHCSHGVLIAALGNPDVTPDALGSLAAENVLVTRHLKQRGQTGFSGFASTMLCRTGVLGTTGVESAVQIRALCRAMHPDCVIAVDALAGSELSGLCRSVQICDTGIAPGSGVKNDREALTREALGVPVIAVGVPTVMDAGSLQEAEGLSDCFVTPRYIDSAVRSAARVIGYGINLALHPGLSLPDIDLLLG